MRTANPRRSRRFAHSVADAVRGIAAAWRTERNFRVEVMCAVLAAAAAAIVLVLTAELFNTAIEHMVDAFTDRTHPAARVAKDAAAAAVLLVATAAGIGGAVIFTAALRRLLG